MKIIVTGGAGFIGSHVVDAYVKAGHHVVVVDDLSKGSRSNVNKKANFFKADICDEQALVRIFKKERPQIVNHHAAIATVAQVGKNTRDIMLVNGLGTWNVLNAFERYGRAPKRFIFISTAAAYNTNRIPADEKQAGNPPTRYGLTKLVGEDMVSYFSNVHGMPYVIFRYSNVVGPRQRHDGEGGVVAIFAHQMRQGVRPAIFGNGKKTRDYIYVGDVARANVLALTRAAGHTMNISTGRETTDQAVFEAVARACSYEGMPRFTKIRPGEARRSALANSRARRLLRWKPKKTLEQAIKLTV